MFKKLSFALAACIGLSAISVVQGSTDVPSTRVGSTRYVNRMLADLEDGGKTLHFRQGLQVIEKGKTIEMIRSPFLEDYYPISVGQCKNVTKVIIPPRIEKLDILCFGEEAFPSLEEVIFEDDENSQLESIGRYAFALSPIRYISRIDPDSGTLKRNHVKLPNLKKIEVGAFGGSKIEQIDIETGSDDVKIEGASFGDCYNLRSFEISGLSTKVLNEENTYRLSWKRKCSIEEEGFRNCYTLKDFTARFRELEVKDKAFLNCIFLGGFCELDSNVQKLTFGNNVFSIGTEIRGPHRTLSRGVNP